MILAPRPASALTLLQGPVNQTPAQPRSVLQGLVSSGRRWPSQEPEHTTWRHWTPWPHSTEHWQRPRDGRVSRGVPIRRELQSY